jgi:nitroimidazol reductase NimA-like FMN-containing flavoprotein (pyridoxamine 5'-phosphate oxidase superfamily)
MDAVGVRDLSPAECLARLRSATWGRVAISMHTIALVVPVPVVVVEDRVVFATARGSTFDRAVHDQPISVQVEGREPGPEDGELLWSVVLSGVCVPGERPPVPVGAVADDVRWNAVACSLVQGWRAPLPMG